MSSEPLFLRRPAQVPLCSIKRTLDVIGDTWSLLILREAFWGVSRFQDFQRFLGLPRAVLSGRLEKLTDHGIFERKPYRQQGARTRHEYVLTKAGRELVVVLVALHQWGDRHLGLGPTKTIDRVSGKQVSIQFVSEDDELIEIARVAPAMRKEKPSR